MRRREMFSTIGLVGSGLLACHFNPTLADESDSDDKPELPETVCSFDECADACLGAAKACGACFDHCTTLLQAGQ